MPHSTKLTPEDKAACRELARLFKAKKQAHGMTHKELGARVGLSEKAISAIVNERMRVSVSNARKFAKVFCVPLTQIHPWTADIIDETGQLSELIELCRSLSKEDQAVVRTVAQALAKRQN